MGGIVVAAGEGAEHAVRRGAGPLARRPWQSLRLCSASRVALGCCSERGGLVQDDGIVVVVDGELVAGERTVSADAAARVVLEAYRRVRARLHAPAGQFAAAVWDETRQELLLVVDLLGSRPLYIARIDGLVVAAGEIKSLVAAGVERSLDLDGAAQLLSYEHLLGGTTPLGGVRLLPPASTTVIGASGIQTLGSPYRVASMSDAGADVQADADASVRRFGALLESAVVRRRDEDTALALSGGLDSRCLASILGTRWPGSLAFTFATPGSEELANASRVAAAARLEHHPLDLERGYVARWAAETVWLSEGLIRCFHSHHLALRRVRERFGVTTLLAGYAGEIVRAVPLAASVVPRTCSGVAELVDVAHARATVAFDARLLERLLTPRFAAELRGRARESLRGRLEQLDGPPLHRFLDFYVQDVYRRKIVPGFELFADDVVHRDPYQDGEVLDFIARLPLWLRGELALQPAFLRLRPSLARVPNTKDGIAPGFTGWRQTVARNRVRVRRGVRRRLDGPLRRVGLTPRSGYSDYTSHLRGHLGADVLGVLLEDRTLDRGQIQKDAVRALVEATLAGRVGDTQVLGTLLTLELFQRQFIDADGFDGALLEPFEAAAPGTERPPETSTLGAC